MREKYAQLFILNKPKNFSSFLTLPWNRIIVVLQTGDDISKLFEILVSKRKNIPGQAFCGTVMKHIFGNYRKQYEQKFLKQTPIGATTAGRNLQDKISSEYECIDDYHFENVSIESSFSSVDDSLGVEKQESRLKRTSWWIESFHSVRYWNK